MWCDCWQAVVHIMGGAEDSCFLQYYCSLECYDNEFPEPSSSEDPVNLYDNMAMYDDIPTLEHGSDEDTEEEQMPVVRGGTERKES